MLLVFKQALGAEITDVRLHPARDAPEASAQLGECPTGRKKKSIPETRCKDETKLGQPTSLDVILGSSYDLEQLAAIEGRMTE